jgi:hypothetical protein
MSGTTPKCLWRKGDCAAPVTQEDWFCDEHRPPTVWLNGVQLAGVLAVEFVPSRSGEDRQP